MKEIREERQIGIKEFANLVDYSESAIYRWEKGQRIPSVEVLITYAKFFSVSADYLLGLTDY